MRLRRSRTLGLRGSLVLSGRDLVPAGNCDTSEALALRGDDGAEDG